MEENTHILSNAIASLEIEGLHPTSYDMKMALKLYYGEIDVESAVAEIISHYKANP